MTKVRPLYTVILPETCYGKPTPKIANNKIPIYNVQLQHLLESFLGSPQPRTAGRRFLATFHKTRSCDTNNYTLSATVSAEAVEYGAESAEGAIGAE